MTDDETTGTELLAALSRADLPAQQRLQARLAAAAGEAQLLAVAYRTLDTPVGPLLLAATEQGLVRVAYAREDHDAVLQQLADRISPRVLRAPARLDPVARELQEYFDGRRRAFDLALDWRLVRGPFRQAVLHRLPGVAYGQTVSYAALAATAGNAAAVRAVGTACATNPLPVVVPCHRVVRSDGTPGQYVGGPDAKHALLRLEAAA
jgi:methylated-DNA-[protein]-cysteine S-methyltransferase